MVSLNGLTKWLPVTGNGLNTQGHGTHEYKWKSISCWSTILPALVVHWWWSVLVASDSTFFVLPVPLCDVNQWWGTLMWCASMVRNSGYVLEQGLVQAFTTWQNGIPPYWTRCSWMEWSLPGPQRSKCPIQVWVFLVDHMRLRCVCLRSLIFSMCNMLPPWYFFSTLVDLTRLHHVAPLFLSSLCTTQRFHCVALLCISLCAFFHQLHSSITFGGLFLFAPLSNFVCEFLPLLVFFHLILLWWFGSIFLWASMKFFSHFCF